MGRNNEDFQNQVLYHGSYHPFEVGDTVHPTSELMPAYAPSSRKEASTYGDVYEVTPISVSNSYKTPSGTTHYESNAGFKVIK